MPGPQPCHYHSVIFRSVGRGLDPSGGGVEDAAPYILHHNKNGPADTLSAGPFYFYNLSYSLSGTRRSRRGTGLLCKTVAP